MKRLQLNLRLFLAGLVLISAIHSEAVLADESQTVYVSSMSGYLRDDFGQIVRTLPRLSKLSVMEQKDERLKVLYRRRVRGWIHRSQVRDEPVIPLERGTPDQQKSLREAWLLCRESWEFVSENEFQEAAARMKRAVETARNILGDDPSLARLLSDLAVVQDRAGEAETSRETLAAAFEVLRKSGQPNHPYLANLLNARAILNSVTDPQSAVSDSTRSLGLLRAEVGSDHVDSAILLANLATACSFAGDNAKATDLFRQHLDAVGRTFGKDTREAAMAHLFLGHALSGGGNVREACDHYRSCLEIRQLITGLQSPDTAEAHIYVGAAAGMLQDAETARSELELAAQILSLTESDGRGLKKLAADYQKQLFPSRNLSEALSKLIPGSAGEMLVTHRQAQLMASSTTVSVVPEATPLWSLELRDQWHRVRVPGASGKTAWVNSKDVSSLSGVIDASRTQDVIQAFRQYDATVQQARQIVGEAGRSAEEVRTAMQTIERAIQRLEEVAGEDPALAARRMQFANDYSELGQYQKARHELDCALATQQYYLGDEHPEYAGTLATKAQLLELVGDIPGAERHFRESLRILDATVGQDAAEASLVRAAFGNHLVSTGRMEDGERLIAVTLRAETDAGRDVSRTLVICHQALSRVAESRDQPLDKLRHLQTALKLLRAVNDPRDETNVLILQHELGEAMVAAGKLQDGLRQLQYAWQATKETLGSDHIMTSLVASRLAAALAMDGQEQQALKLAAQSLNTATRLKGPDDLQNAEVLTLLARLHCRQGNIDRALQQFDRSHAITVRYVRNVLADLATDDQYQFLSARSRQQGQDAALNLALQHPNNPHVVDRTATWVLNTKSLAMETAAAQGQLLSLLQTNAAVTRYNAWHELRQRVNTFSLEALSPDLRQQRLAELEQLKTEMQEQLPNVAPGFAQQFAAQTRGIVDINQVREALSPEEVLVEFRRLLIIDPGSLQTVSSDAEQCYVAWVIPAAGDQPVTVLDFGSADEIDSMITALRAAILNSPNVIRQSGEIVAVEQYRKAALPFFERVYLPLAQAVNDIGNVRKLNISPDGGLWMVPWSALLVAEDRFLIEDFEVQLVNSGRILVAVDADRAIAENPVVLADPSFDADGKTIDDAVRLLELDIPPGEVGDFKTQLNAVAQLPGTRAEAASIRPGLIQITGRDPEIYVGDQAAESVFKSLLRPQILVVATHGFLLTDESANPNPLSRCGLLLAGCNHAGETQQVTGDDGILTGSEIVRTNLRGTELVVLSACETALGTIRRGDGVAGLQQSFQLAGARSVIASLWPIPDRETAQLMAALFENLASGSTHPGALRSAMLSRIQSRRTRYGAAYPLFWAAFTITGAN
ncbi:MAG: CHAT domain-containing protein [Planctomycetaceae bacterium]|nr:CHAT domain-containing protein [Planctomycetaceae bacterium]